MAETLYFWVVRIAGIVVVLMFAYGFGHGVYGLICENPEGVEQGTRCLGLPMATIICVTSSGMYKAGGEIWPSFYSFLLDTFGGWFPNKEPSDAWTWGTLCVIFAVFAINIILRAINITQEIKARKRSDI